MASNTHQAAARASDAAMATRALARFIPTDRAAFAAVPIADAGMASALLVALHALDAGEATDDLLELTTGELHAIGVSLMAADRRLAHDLADLVRDRLCEVWR